MEEEDEDDDEEAAAAVALEGRGLPSILFTAYIYIYTDDTIIALLPFLLPACSSPHDDIPQQCPLQSS